MYKIIISGTILRTADNAVIPTDEANSDYVQYLNWLAEGNIPETIIGVPCTEVPIDIDINNI